ncbi:YybH family protein [Herbiconiux liukaitaii]|uniref:YybH family protein n=1 Tax=Herbiconiux liukaitaii TaxID=3342799 RepID=UPI0035B6BB30
MNAGDGLDERESFQVAVDRVGRALAAMGEGDPDPFRACWAADADTTLYGAFGTLERGHDAIDATLAWVGGRFSGGTLAPTYEVVHAGADVGYTVGRERGVVAIDGAEPREVVIRVTHVYRRDASGRWLLVHRHGDHPPVREFATGS